MDFPGPWACALPGMCREKGGDGMKCAALRTFTMCVHLPRGLRVQIPIAGLGTLWFPGSSPSPLGIPDRGGFCKWAGCPKNARPRNQTPQNSSPSAMADAGCICRGRPHCLPSGTPQGHPKNRAPSHPPVSVDLPRCLGCQKRSCVLRACQWRGVPRCAQLRMPRGAG